MLAIISTRTGSTRWCARSITKWIPPPASTELRLAIGNNRRPVFSWILTTMTWRISASQNTGVASPRKVNVVAV